MIQKLPRTFHNGQFVMKRVLIRRPMKITINYQLIADDLCGAAVEKKNKADWPGNYLPLKACQTSLWMSPDFHSGQQKHVIKSESIF